MFKKLYIGFVLSILFCRGAFAQEIPDTCPEVPSDLESAKALAGIWFNKAEASVKQEHYAEAVGEFRCSLKMVEHPATSYNAAIAAKKAGYLSIALDLAKRCVELDANMEERVRPLIQELEEAIALALKTDKAEEPTPPPPEEPEPEPEPEPVQPEPEPTPPPPVEPEPEPQPVPTAEPEQRNWVIPTGWAALGLGGAALITSAILGGMALSIDGELEGECVDGHCPPDTESKIDRMNAMATATNVLIGVGAAGATAGAILLIWGYKNRGETDETVAVTPFASTDVAGFAVQGRF